MWALSTLAEEVLASIFVCRDGKILVTYYECNHLDFEKRIH